MNLMHVSYWLFNSSTLDALVFLNLLNTSIMQTLSSCFTWSFMAYYFSYAHNFYFYSLIQILAQMALGQRTFAWSSLKNAAASVNINLIYLFLLLSSYCSLGFIHISFASSSTKGKLYESRKSDSVILSFSPSAWIIHGIKKQYKTLLRNKISIYHSSFCNIKCYLMQKKLYRDF